MPNVVPGTPYDDLERLVRSAIVDHFTLTLNRPELLNRIGDNIVIFDYISAEIGARLVDLYLHNVVARVQKELALNLTFTEAVRDDLARTALADPSLGGRGIGASLESCFVNPLARALFGLDQGKEEAHVTSVTAGDRWRVGSDPDMKILLSRAHFPVTVLGVGLRIGIWFQGCHIRCRGCVSRPTPGIQIPHLLSKSTTSWPGAASTMPTTWRGSPSVVVNPSSNLKHWKRFWRDLTAGARITPPHSMDLLCFSGKRLVDLERDHANILRRLDALVSEPYVEHLATDLPLRGSSNQRIVLLSTLGRLRYSGAESNAAALRAAGRMQVDVDDDSIWYIGIPSQGDMVRLKEGAPPLGV